MPMKTAMFANWSALHNTRLPLRKNCSSAFRALLSSEEPSSHSVRTLASSMQMIGQLLFGDLY